MSRKKRKQRRPGRGAEEPMTIRGVAAVVAIFTLGFLFLASLGYHWLIVSGAMFFSIGVLQFISVVRGFRPTFIGFLNDLMHLSAILVGEWLYLLFKILN